MDGFIWCPHCGKPHLLSTRSCPEKGKQLPEVKGIRERPPPAASPSPRAPVITDRNRDRGRGQQRLVGTIIDERYRLRAVIGRGGYGTVFEAENLRFGGRVALKLLDHCDASTIRRFNQEARIAGTVLHPNVCQVFDVGWVNDRPYCVMELLTGETLAQRLERKGALSISGAIDMIVQVLGGLSAAHDAGVVHRDVKPQNVFMVRRQGCSPAMKLLDFGLAKALDGYPKDRQVTSTATMPGRVVGTVAYMSPEQLMGAPIDARSDLFSCAVVLFEAVTGVLPWRGRSRADVGAAILRDTQQSITVLRPRAAAELESILSRGLTKDRTKRFQSAYDFLRALGSLQRTRRSMIVAPTVADDEPDDEPSTAQVIRTRDERPEVSDSESTTKMSAPLSSASAEVPLNVKATQPILPRMYTNAPPSSRRRGSSSSSGN